MDLLTTGHRGAVALDSGTHRRGGQHRAGAANRVADRSWTCAARCLRRHGVDQLIGRLRQVCATGRVHAKRWAAGYNILKINGNKNNVIKLHD